MKKTYSTTEHYEDNWKIIQRHYLYKFEHHKLTFETYSRMSTIDKANTFALPKGLLKRMGRFVDETGSENNHSMQFIRHLEEQGKVKYHAKVTRVYKSEKRFHLPPWIEITPY